LRDGEPDDIVAFDLYSKLRVAVTPLNDEAYLCAWLYRQGRRLGTTYRHWDRPDVAIRMDAGGRDGVSACAELPDGTSSLTAVATAVAGRRAYLRGQDSLQIIEW
jgi:hypothetical protein